MATIVTKVEEQTYRSPRPGFFVGDEGNVPRCSPLVADEKLSTSCSLGRLGGLPLELLQQILSQVDICALVKFHNINQATRAIARSLIGFKEVAAFPRVLNILVHLQHCSVNLASLATRLRNTRCITCGHYGDYVYLITIERVCYPCLRSRVDFSPVPKEKTGLSEQELKALPHVHTTPGRYGVFACCDSSLELYDRRQVLALRAQKPDLEVTRDRSSRKAVRVSIGSCGKPNPLRYMATIPGPYLDTATNSFDRGMCCRACVNTTRTPSHTGWDDPLRKFTTEDIHAHIELYGTILKHPDGTYTHDSPRCHNFRAAPEFDAAMDLCHNYDKITINSYESLD